MIDRRVTVPVTADLPRKMVLLSGPRQAGKTTLVRRIVVARHGRYFSWDRPADRLAIQKRQLDEDRPLWAFDELHKFRRWRAFVKDLSDSPGRQHEMIVTGSARLEMYGHGGDSLQGRYLAHHLHPLTYSELCGFPFGSVVEVPALRVAPTTRVLDDLLRLGGFPEPFLSGSDRWAARWRLAYGARLVEEEVTSLEQVRELERLELLFDRLSDVAGGVISLNSLREDLEVAFETVRSWVAILERLDAVFRLSPYGAPRIKAVKKEQKLYFWDWARCASEGARFENLLALHLLRMVHWAADVEGEKLQLRYFRHRSGLEVDFVVLRARRPWLAVEATMADSELTRGLRYFVERFHPEAAFQVVLHDARERRLPDIGPSRVQVVSAARFLANLP